MPIIREWRVLITHRSNIKCKKIICCHKNLMLNEKAANETTFQMKTAAINLSGFQQLFFCFIGF